MLKMIRCNKIISMVYIKILGIDPKDQILKIPRSKLTPFQTFLMKNPIRK